MLRPSLRSPAFGQDGSLRGFLVIWRTLRGCLGLSLLCAAIGCGGDDAAKKSSVPAPSGTPGASRPDSDGGYGDGGYGQSQPEEPQGPELPEKFGDWTAEDYLAAKQANAPKLEGAVKFLGLRKGRDETAETLFSLLLVDKADTTEPGAGSNDGYGRSDDGYGRGGGGGYGRDGYGQQQGGTVQIDAELARTIVATLGKNGSQTSRKHLRTLVTGKVQTALDGQTQFTEALAALIDNPHPDNQEIIFQLATEPEKLIAYEQEVSSDAGRASYGGGGGMSPGAVQREVIEELEVTASAELRIRLAKFLDDPKVIAETAESLERMLSAEDPRNLPAQIVLYQNRATSEQTMTTLQQRLTEDSRSAFGFLMGMDIESSSGSGGRFDRGYDDDGYGDEGRRTGRGRGGRGRGRMGIDGRESDLRPLGPPTRSFFSTGRRLAVLEPFAQRGERPRRDSRPSRDEGYGNPRRRAAPPEQDPVEAYTALAKLLWTDIMARQIGSQLLDADTLNDKREMAQLLAAMPVPKAREMMKQIFEKYEDEGPQTFSSVGFLGSEALDPTFLLLAKGAYHGKKSARTRTPRPQGTGRGRGGDSGYAQGSSDPDSDPWVTEVENTIAAIGERLSEAEGIWVHVEPAADEAAKDKQAKADENQAPTRPRDAMAVRLHRGVDDEAITAEYHLRWPDDAAKRLPGVSVVPLEVHYIRIEHETKPQTLVTFYKKYAGTGVKSHVSDGRMWYDGLIKNRKTGEQRSVDIQIYNADPADNDLRRTEARDVVVEILVISIPGDEAGA